MDENTVRLLIALAGAGAGALLNRALARPKERKVLAASVINGVCSALRGMIDGFAKNNIPREHGHAFLALLKDFEASTEPAIGVDALRHLSKLRSLANRAMEYDGYITENHISPAEAKDWIEQAERVIGELSAIAAKQA